MNEEMAIKTLVRVEREQALLRGGEEAVGFNMSDWFNGDGDVRDEMGNYCHTTACFAGHAAMEAGWVPVNRGHACQNVETGKVTRWSLAGADALGLTDEADSPFYLPDLAAVYRWVADHLGLDVQVLRDKVKAEVGE